MAERRSRWARVPWAASIALHAALLVVMAHRAEPPPKKKPAPTIRWVEAKAPATTPASPEPQQAAPPRPSSRPAPRPAPSGPAKSPVPMIDAPPPAPPPAPTAREDAAARAGVLRAKELDLALHPDASGRASTRLPSAGDQGVGAVPGQTFAAHGEALIPGLSPIGGGAYSYADRGFSALIARDGTVVFDDDALPITPFAGAILTFDITEVLMALHGEDPFYVQKLSFLKRTWSMRSKMCATARKENLDLAVQGLKKTLDRVWSDPKKSSAQRRRVLFDLWDQCAENETDPDIARAAAMARATVLAFIQERAPDSSEERFTEHELAELNRRRLSKAEFQPYIPPAR